MSKRPVFTDPRLCKHLRKRAGVCKTSLANAAMTVGAVDTSPTTRYVHNTLGQRLFKTEPQFPPAPGDENDPTFMASLIAFFSNLWGGNTGAANPSASEKLGFQYYYDEDGSLLYELGSGGANSTGAAHYVYLPTPSGPMPIAFYNGSKHYAIHTDHLNTPRRLTNSSKQVAWQWAFSAFGDELPTTGARRYVDPVTTPNAGSTTIADVTFNLRYPGQYFDKESGLNYNYFRSYDSRTGRYSQSDPIDLAGGWNKFAYVEGNPLFLTDPLGLDPGVRLSGYKGFGGSYTTNGSVHIVRGGVGAGGEIVALPNVQMPGSGGADGTFGFGGGLNVTVGSLSCSLNCSAGWELYKDTITGRLSVKFYEDCKRPQLNGRGQGGTGINATANLGVQGGYRAKK